MPHWNGLDVDRCFLPHNKAMQVTWLLKILLDSRQILTKEKGTLVYLLTRYSHESVV